MLDEHPVTTKNRYMASLLLKEDDSAVHLERDRRAPLKHLYRIRCGATHESGSSKVGIHGQESSESIASTSQQEDNISLPQFHFMLNTHHAYIDAGPNSLRVVQVPSASGGGSQLSLWESGLPAADAGQDYADRSAMLYSHMRRIIEQPVVTRPWGVSGVFQLRSWEEAESRTVIADSERGGKSAILSEILEEFDAVFQWKEYHALSQDNARINTQQEIEEILHWYAEKASQLPQVEKVKYKRRKKSILFLVVVNRIQGGVSRQLSQIESQLCDEHINRFFEFEHVGSRAFSRQSRTGYNNLFNRD